MIKKLRELRRRRNAKRVNRIIGAIKRESSTVKLYTMDQLENAFKLGYNDGKRDGLAIAREQAMRSLSEILKSQNKVK